MSRRRESGEPSRHEPMADRREFLERSVASASLLLVPSFGRTSGRAKSSSFSPAAVSSSGSLMAAAAEAFLNSLTSEQRAKATFALEDEQRFDWHFVPRARKGVSFKDLDRAQQHLAYALLGAGLGQRGLIKVSTIMSLETVLREIEQGRGPARDPELYFFNLFGGPRSQKPWGWRIEGHHVSLNFTIGDETRVAVTPAFLGANPAEVRHGPRAGLRALAAEEDLARELLKSLDAEQRRQAVINQNAPSDILSANSRKASPLTPVGLQASKLTKLQTDMLMKLLAEYAATAPADLATIRLEKIRSAGLSRLSFAWAGSLERNQPHYYRLQGPAFLIEYDNTQNNANHIHTVWRDFTGDFGLDLLAAHYQDAHRK